MASFDTCIKGRPRRDGSWNLKLRITHRRQSRWLPTNITVHADEVTRRGAIKSRAILDRSEDLLRQVRGAAAKLSPFTLDAMDVDELVRWLQEELRGRGWRLDFIAWCYEHINAMPRAEGTRDNYRQVVRSFTRWLGADRIDINDLTARQIRGWSDSLEPKAVAAMYPRALAALHRKARMEFNDPDAAAPLIARNPFEGFDKRMPPPEGQQSLGVAGIQALIDARPASVTERYALDVFLLSFALLGINLVDLYQLRPPVDGWVEYYRQKTVTRGRKSDSFVRVRVPDEVAPIVARLRATRGERWLNLSQFYASIHSAAGAINGALSRYCERTRTKHFTYYAARHSWATIAHTAAGLSRDTADECLSHRGRNQLVDIYIERDWNFLNAEAAKVLPLFDWRNL